MQRHSFHNVDQLCGKKVFNFWLPREETKLTCIALAVLTQSASSLIIAVREWVE